ncbi:hypothetical protein [Nonomuraea helvata]|uniref:Glycosyl hydrolase n=1 Tax=Nonomuraea helvata TaxID=37484 RepID=A0ABV5S564_9ACTN
MTWERISAIDLAIGVGVGKAAHGSRHEAKRGGYPAIYTSATVAGQDGIFRSTDGGATWVRINDDDHQWAFAGSAITGDPHIFGRVYLSARGVIYGDIADEAGRPVRRGAASKPKAGASGHIRPDWIEYHVRESRS